MMRKALNFFFSPLRCSMQIIDFGRCCYGWGKKAIFMYARARKNNLPRGCIGCQRDFSR